MALPNENGVLIHNGKVCSPLVVPTATSIPYGDSNVGSALDKLGSNMLFDNIANGQTKNFTFNSQYSLQAFIFVSRNDNVRFIGAIDYWNASMATLVGTATGITCSHNANSNDFSITNNSGSTIHYIMINAKNN